MDERYPIGETTSVAVAVLRHERHDAGYPMWSASIGLRGGEATVSVPGHYPTVLAQRLRSLTALTRDGEESLALSSTARSPVRVTVEVPRSEIEPLAQLLDHAQRLIEELRQGLGLVPDSLPDGV